VPALLVELASVEAVVQLRELAPRVVLEMRVGIGD
jgi:hypothetical protein